MSWLTRWWRARFVGSALSGNRPWSEVKKRTHGDRELRQLYDRTALGLRGLAEGEGDDPAPWELDLVADRLAAGLAPETGEGRRSAARTWAWLTGGAAVAAAVALVLWVVPRGIQPDPDSELMPRGAGGTVALAIDVLCGEPTGPDTRAVPASAGACQADGQVGFALRVAPDLAGAERHVALFGIDGAGRVLYYAPTPADPAPLSLPSGRWEAAPIAVDLGVNHRPGRVQVFAIATSNPVELADVDRWAEAVVQLPPFAQGDPPWHRLVPARVLGEACADPEDCHSARTSFRVEQERP